jgi:2-aminomuconate deaminase
MTSSDNILIEIRFLLALALESGMLTNDDIIHIEEELSKISDIDIFLKNSILSGLLSTEEFDILNNRLISKNHIVNSTVSYQKLKANEVFILKKLFGLVKDLPSVIYSERAPGAVGLYPHARRVGNFLFLSGVGPRKKNSDAIPGVTLNENGDIISYDIEEQCRSVFDNVKLILEDAGSKWEKVVDVTVFLTNMKDDFSKYNELYAEYFKDVQPSRTTLEINALPTPIAIELKVIAVV